MAHNIKKGNHVTLKGMNCDSFSLVLHLELALSDTQATRRKGLIEANSFGRPKKKIACRFRFVRPKLSISFATDIVSLPMCCEPSAGVLPRPSGASERPRKSSRKFLFLFSWQCLNLCIGAIVGYQAFDDSHNSNVPNLGRCC